jgi:hypothetical protein
MLDLFSPDVWKRQWEAFMKAPYVIFPTLIVGTVVSWWFCSMIHQSEIAGLRERIQLAAEKVELANQAKAEVEREVNGLNISSNCNGDLPVRVAKVEDAIRKLSLANDAVRSVVGTGTANGEATASGAGAFKLGPTKCYRHNNV